MNEQGTGDALSSRWEASFAQVRALSDDGTAPDEVEKIERLVRRYLAGREALFDRRIEQGRVVDGHGDLFAEDIFCLDDGPRVLDYPEFDDHLRYVDGLDDAAFLAMDLEQLGAPEAAAFFLTEYGEYSGDPAPPPSGTITSPTACSSGPRSPGSRRARARPAQRRQHAD